MGYPDKLAKVLGYGLSLAPNIARNSLWSVGISRTGTLQGLKANGIVDNETRLLKSGKKLGEDWDTITMMRKWDFIVLLKEDRITLAKMRKPDWWSFENYDRSIRNKVSEEQAKKLYKLIDKELKDMDYDEICYSYAKSYKSWFQPLMDRLRTELETELETAEEKELVFN